jgi:hypothetical protein
MDNKPVTQASHSNLPSELDIFLTMMGVGDTKPVLDLVDRTPRRPWWTYGETCPH